MVLFPLMFSSCICFLISIFSCFPLLFLIRPARIFFVLCFPPPFPSKEPELITSFFKLYWHFASIRILSPDPWALLIAQEFLKGRCWASLVFMYLPGTWTQHMTHTQFFTFCFCTCDFAHLIELQGGFHWWQSVRWVLHGPSGLYGEDDACFLGFIPKGSPCIDLHVEVVL